MSQRKHRADGLLEKKKKINGKVVHFYGRTAAEVERKIDEYKASLAERAALGASFDKVYREWYAQWEQSVKPSTLYSARPVCKHIYEEFHGQYMKEITPTVVSSYLARLRDQGYAKGTLRNHRTILSGIVKHWVVYFGGNFDSVAYAPMPSGTRLKERQPPTEAQLAAVKAHPGGFGLAAWVFLYTGCRLGEAIALQWQDIDFGAGVVHVTKSVWWSNNIPMVQPPKTPSAVRDVPLLLPLRDLLLKRQGKPGEYIFSGLPRPLTRSEYRSAWTGYFRELGFAELRTGYAQPRWESQVTAHQFRHAMASLLYEAGIGEMEAQRILGHASIVTTRAVYTHLRQAQLKAAADKLNAFLVVERS